MEIEVKYSIKDEATADKIWDDEMFLDCEEADSREKLHMKAAYFDTDDYVLSKNDIAFRVRREGGRIVATLKWGGSSEGALHQREELNVPVDDEACLLMPSPELFKESDIGREVIALLEGKPLSCIVEVNIIRRRLRIDIDDSIMEISVDTGEIVTDNGTAPISEVEVELFSGETENILKVGELLKEKYALEEGLQSKYARGLKLLGLI